MALHTLQTVHRTGGGSDPRTTETGAEELQLTDVIICYLSVKKETSTVLQHDDDTQKYHQQICGGLVPTLSTLNFFSTGASTGNPGNHGQATGAWTFPKSFSAKPSRHTWHYSWQKKSVLNRLNPNDLRKKPHTHPSPLTPRFALTSAAPLGV